MTNLNGGCGRNGSAYLCKPQESNSIHYIHTYTYRFNGIYSTVFWLGVPKYLFSGTHYFLELIIGPTCSIIYENEPMEQNTMLQKPRPFSTTFFNCKELTTSVIQGLVITAGTLIIYRYAVSKALNIEVTRTMVFTTLIAANILLTLINRSLYYSLLTTIKYKNNMVLIIILLTVVAVAALLYIRPLSVFFGFEPLSRNLLLISTAAGFLSVIWFELIKFRNGKIKTNSCVL